MKNEVIKTIYNAIEDKKGEDIRILDISNVTVIADYFVIATGNNPNQVQAIADNVSEELFKKHGLTVKQTEGYNSASWILMDYGDYIIHIFDKEERFFYDLERIWRDGKEINM